MPNSSRFDAGPVLEHDPNRPLMSRSTVPTALIIASQLRDLLWFVESRLDNLLHGNASFRTLTLTP